MRHSSITRHTNWLDLERFDHIIAATGYRYGCATLPFLSTTIRNRLTLRHDQPVVDHTFQSSLPGLYFIGPITEPLFGPAMKFMIGAHYAAPRLAAHLRH